MSLTKYNFICINDDCENKFKNISVIKEEGDEAERCEFCDEKMKLMGESPYGGVNRFNSLSPDQKKKVLLKRSRNHFNRFIKDKKEQFNKDFHDDIKN